MRKFILSAAMILCGAAAVPVLAAKGPAAIVKTQASEEAESREHMRQTPRREEAPHNVIVAQRNEKQRNEKGKDVPNTKHEEEDRYDD